MRDQEFFQRLNMDLTGLENELFNSAISEKYPNFFILGLPRSGTTMLNQLLFNCLNIACTNNLMAKFWETPLVGAYLSKTLLGKYKPQKYDSVYGKNNDIASPHEFSYFWHRLLSIKPSDIETYNADNIKNILNWNRIRLTFLNINLLYK